MKDSARYCGLGLLIAGLEEFITQGVLKDSYGGWILPTLAAFVPFLIVARMMGWWLDRSLSEPGALLNFYVAAGAIGILVEWLLIGLSPWRDPHAPKLAMLVFQLGMFSFWSGVAFAPRLLLDRREPVRQIRSACQRYLAICFATIYSLTLAAPKTVQFPIGIGLVLATFLGLNFFHWRYLRVAAGMNRRPT